MDFPCTTRWSRFGSLDFPGRGSGRWASVKFPGAVISAWRDLYMRKAFVAAQARIVGRIPAQSHGQSQSNAFGRVS